MPWPALHPLWRAAPLRLLRSPGWFVLLLLAVTLVVTAVVAPPLFVATARATALADGLAATAGNPYGDTSGDLRVTWDATLSNRAEAQVLERLAAMPSYGRATLSAASTAQGLSEKAVAVANGRRAPAALWYHDGAVPLLAADRASGSDPEIDPDADGVWLSVDTARELGLEVGDPFRLGLDSAFLGSDSRLAPVVLAGTYDTAADSHVPQVLADHPDVDRWFFPIDPTQPRLPASMAIATHPTFDRLARRVLAAPLYVADLNLDPQVSPQDARAAADATQAFSDDAFDGTTDLYYQLATGRPEGAAPSVITGLPVIVEAAEDTAVSAREQVGPYAAGGQVLAVLLLLAAWLLLGLGRRREQLLVTGLGVRPVERAGLAALEVLLVCVLATPAGIALAGLGLTLAGPASGVRPPVTTQEVARAAAAAGAALLLLAVASGLAALAGDRLDRTSRLGFARTALPWAVALVAATAVVTVAVVTVDASRRSSTPLTTAYPFLVAATVAMVVIRGVGWARARLPTRARPGTPRWLAARRSGPVVREVSALAAVVAVALGLFAYTLAVQRGIDEGVADKTAALAGATTSIEVAKSLRAQGPDRAVEAPFPDSTVVWSRGVLLPPAFGEIPLMAVEPETFAEVADWGASGDLDAGRAALPRLAERTRGLPVILAGDPDVSAGDQTVLDFGFGFSLPVYVVAVVDAFPGSERHPGVTTVVMDSRRMMKLLPPPIDPRRRGASYDDPGSFTSTVWSSRSTPQLRAEMQDAHLDTAGLLTTAKQERIEAGLVASTWAAGYVVALGAVALALALAAGLVLVLRLTDRDVVSDVLLRRMGYAPADLARTRAWEVGYAVATALLAAVVAVAVLVLGPAIIDAAAVIPPPTRPRPGAVDAGALLAVLVGLVLLAWVLGTVAVRRRSAAEVLRAGE